MYLISQNILENTTKNTGISVEYKRAEGRGKESVIVTHECVI